MAVLAFDDPVKVRQRWQPTVDYLNQHLQQHQLVLVALRPHQVDRLVENQAFDFFIGNAVKTLQLKQRHGTSQLLTLKPLNGRNPALAVGSAVVMRANHQVDDWRALQSLQIVSVGQQAFGGFIAFWREIDQHGLSPLSDFPYLKFIGYPQSKLLHSVISGSADAAIVPTCLLESMEASNLIAKGELTVVLQQSSDSPCATSTQLYPYSALSALGHAEQALARQVTRLLLDLHPQDDAAVTGRYGGWTVPVDNREVYALLKDIQLWPFDLELTDFWPELLPYLAAIAALALLAYMHHLRVRALVTRRTAQLRQEIDDHRLTQENLEQQQRGFYKAQRVLLTGEMASGIAHELNQPLASIRYLTQGCQYRLESEVINKDELHQGLQRVGEQTERARQIIQKLRDFCAHNSEATAVDMVELVKDTLTLMAPDCRHNSCHIDLEYDQKPLIIQGDPTLLKQVLVNLMRNGMEAMQDQPKAERKLKVSLTSDTSWLTLKVQDKGPQISQEKLARLFLPFESDKPQGLGLGMTICKRIIEEHQGQIEACSCPQGLTLICRLPLRKAS